LAAGTPGLLAQTGTDCFGIEGITVRIIDADGQPFELVTNRAGNFYVEGNPDDFAKPFSAAVIWNNADAPAGVEPQVTPMAGTFPSYGGCGRCHTAVAGERFDPDLEAGDTPDMLFAPTARIGLPGYGPGANGEATVQNELTRIGCEQDPTNRICERLDPLP
jgi:hypothetical protein